MWKVPLFELNYDQRESDAVQQVLDSRWLTMGEKTNAFESEFSTMLQSPGVQCTFVSNCTSALYMSLLALDIKQGDEVIVPAMTFVADVNATLMAGATPVLADCESLDNWNMSAETIKELITPKTKAVIIVHFAGYPCDMDPIIELCKAHKLFLIEDVAHAPGAAYKGRACGTMGDIGCFSFFTNKNLSLGEGGMLSTSTPELHEKLRHLRSHGMSTLTLDRHKGRAVSYDVVRPGLNFRSDEIHAALGLVQLDKLSEANKKRAVMSNYYQQLLAKVKGVELPFSDISDTEPAYHIFPVLLNADINRIKVINYLKECGIQSSIHYPSFHGFSGFKHLNLNAAPLADTISERELTLPLYPDLTMQHVDVIADCLQKAIQSAK